VTTKDGERKAPRLPWVYSILPVSLATGPLATLVQLHLIELNGSSLGVIYAGLAVAAFNGVSIPAAIFWGFASDRIQSRKTIVFVSYSLTALILVSFLLVSNTPGTILVYSIFAFISAATATPLNLLIMESAPKGTWAGAFARLSMVSSVGSVGGLILSTVWAPVLPIILLNAPLGFCALASAALAFWTIKDPPLVLERETIARRQSSFASRLLSLPLLFLRVPSLSDFQRAFRGLRNELTSYAPLFYISVILFYLSSGLFNTSFVPALSALSLSAGEVFAVILAGAVVQTLSFRYAAGYFSRHSLVAASVQGLVLRGSCYALIGALTLLVAGPLFVLPALLLYPIAGGVAFVAYYTASNTMMFNLVQGRNPGSTLGVYSAIVGVATLAGSLLSGFVSVFSGFNVTFGSAAALLLVAAYVVSRLPERSEQTQTRADSA
jgi:MFS family permease